MQLFQTAPASWAPMATATQPEPLTEEETEDWSAADDFMSGF